MTFVDPDNEMKENADLDKSKVETIPPYSFSLQHTKFPHVLLDYAVKEFGEKAAGKKHADYIGKNPSICRKLFGLGYSLQKKFGDMGFTEFSNHIWLPQVNESDSEHRMMQVCLNCGSLVIEGKFIAYTDLKK